MGEPQPLQLRRLSLDWSRTYILGVLNITPDSFSDGGLFLDPEDALTRGAALAEAGADVLDIGGESTRPGERPPVPAAEERARVVPAVEQLSRTHTVSIDTMKAEVADAALQAGAEIVNDVSGGTAEPDILKVAARRGAAVVLGHWGRAGEHRDIVREVCEELAQQVARAVEAGVPRGRVLIDPGLGFGKTGAHNLELVTRLGELKRIGCAIVVGASRKSFLGRVTGRPVGERELATAAAHTAAILHGANIVRVHDVGGQRDAVRMADALHRAKMSS